MRVFFFNDTATTEIYTLSLHDALPIYPTDTPLVYKCKAVRSLELTPFIEAIGGTKKDRNKDYAYSFKLNCRDTKLPIISRSEEHTSELQSRQYLVCRLLLEKKKIYSIFRPIDGFHHLVLLPCKQSPLLYTPCTRSMLL